MDKLSRLISSKDDEYFLHKLLGLTCLGSYLWRFLQSGDKDMGFDESYLTPVTLLLHLSLSLSSLIFRIPQRRIAGSGFRIWPEYRLHSITFASRSLACMMLTYVCTIYDIAPGIWTHVANTAIVLLTCVAADLGSYSVGPANRSHTIRDLYASPATRFHFSVMQFYATSGCIFGFQRYSIHFVMVFIIQFNAFLMTLQRKNIGSHFAMVGAYGLMLSIGFVVGALEVHRASAFWFLSAFSNMAAIARIGLGWNKYFLWIFMSFLMYAVRPTLDDYSFWRIVYLASMAAMAILGYRKIVIEGSIV